MMTMKQFYRILSVVLALVGVGIGPRTAQAQTKEFLQWYQNIRHRIESASEQDSEGAEVMQFPSELLRTLTPKEKHNANNNLLGRIQTIYQMRFTLTKEVQQSWYKSVERLATYRGIYEQRMAIDGNTSIKVLEATKQRGKEPAEFLVFIASKEKGVVCDIVGYITLNDVITMLSPELKREHIKNPIEQIE